MNFHSLRHLAVLACVLTLTGCRRSRVRPDGGVVPDAGTIAQSDGGAATTAVLALDEEDVRRRSLDLAGSKAYASLWTAGSEERRDLFLTIVARSVETLHFERGPDGRPVIRSALPQDLVKRSEKAKLLDIADDVAQLARGRALPADVSAKLTAHLDAVRGSDHLGVWGAATKGRAAFDFSALAAFLRQDDAAYLRELIAARDPQNGVSTWSGTLAASFPWLADERTALARLYQLAPLSMRWGMRARLRELTGEPATTPASSTPAQAADDASAARDPRTRCKDGTYSTGCDCHTYTCCGRDGGMESCDGVLPDARTRCKDGTYSVFGCDCRTFGCCDGHSGMAMECDPTGP